MKARRLRSPAFETSKRSAHYERRCCVPGKSVLSLSAISQHVHALIVGVIRGKISTFFDFLYKQAKILQNRAFILLIDL